MTTRKKRRTTSDTTSDTTVKEFVTVAFAEDQDLAKQYKKLLNDSEIPAAIKTQPNPNTTFPGIAVLVPEDHLDEAHQLIESQGSNDSFYDLAFDDSGYDEDDLDADLYE